MAQAKACAKFLLRSLLQTDDGISRCVSAYLQSKNANTIADVTDAMYYFRYCKINVFTKHSELYLCSDWRIKWKWLSKHQKMALHVVLQATGFSWGGLTRAHPSPTAFTDCLAARLGPAFQEGVRALLLHRYNIAYLDCLQSHDPCTEPSDARLQTG